MILLDVTVTVLGRMLVHDDYTIEEVLYLPTTDETEIQVLQKVLHRKSGKWVQPREAFISACASTFALIPSDLIFHLATELVLTVEPTMDEDAT